MACLPGVHSHKSLPAALSVTILTRRKCGEPYILTSFYELLNMRQSHNPLHFVGHTNTTVVLSKTILCFNKTLSTTGNFSGSALYHVFN
jgi:hypothetical protein